MSDEIHKQSVEIIQGVAEKYLTEGAEPQLEVKINKLKLN